MVKTVAFHNLGCKVNTYETEKMMKELAEQGFLIVPFDQKADIYIVNTCSVTNIADRKSRQMLHRARALNPDAVVVAAGCYVNTHADGDSSAGNAGSSEKPGAETEGVDICITNEQKKDIADILNKYLATHDFTNPFNTGVDSMNPGEYPPCQLPEIQTIQATDASDNLSKALHTRCFIKVQDGCDQFCTYCIIPYARGRINSRPVSEIITEIQDYTQEDYKEFVPTGIHISSYGKDRPEDGEDLLMLIQRISETEGVKRIRLSSLEPRIITEDFARSLSNIDQLCPHFHLSLQSGSDTVLRRMNRHYTTDEFMESVDILRSYFNAPAITTDIITGFPGETEEEFAETVDFVRKADFYETHVFKYSRRRGTAADKMQGQLPEAVKHERSKVLIEMNRRRKEAFENLYISEKRRTEVLFEDMENVGGVSYRTGYTREYIKVYDISGTHGAGDIADGTLARQGNMVLFEGQ